MGFEDYGLECNNPDWVLYAETYGLHGYQVDLPVDCSENTKVLIDELSEKVCVV